MRLDRIAEDILIFTSPTYAQVTATVLLTDEGAIVVDTLPFPAETRELVAYIERMAGRDAVRYVINTHHHADHIYGTYLFPSAQVIAHDECRRILQTVGPVTLAKAKRETPALKEVALRLPDMTFQREMHLQLGHRQLHLFHTPGHTSDGISVFVVGEKALIAGDAVMPVPHISGGNVAQLKGSLLQFRRLKPSFVVQGHGDVLLRGEISETLLASRKYLDAIETQVAALVARGASPRELADIDVESCGLSRIPLDGLVSRLHIDNLAALYRKMTRDKA